MSSKFAQLARYRPRFATLLLCVAVAAPTILANCCPRKPSQPALVVFVMEVDYGWPLIWCRRSYDSAKPRPWNLVRYSLPALAGNLGILLAMSAAVGIPCEWRLRRHPLRWNFSLRTMILAVGILAAFFAWCAALRHRADLQDSFLADLKDEEVRVDFEFERWGPQWLALVLPDRFRRRVVQAGLWEPDAEVLQRLAQLHNLRTLVVPGAKWTSLSASALGEMQRLRERLRQAKERCDSAEAAPREGQRAADNPEKSCCARPGCYELFFPSSRSPLKKCCGRLCRRA